MKTEELLSWQQIADIIARGGLVSPIEWFVYRNEPVNEVKKTLWRSDLIELIHALNQTKEG